MNNPKLLDEYLKKENNEIELNLYILDICPEYYDINGIYHLNKEFKKITFSQDDYNYTANMLIDDQLEKVLSIKYGKTLIEGPTGSGKTTIMLSRAIKLARIYPHHNFIIFTHTKQLCNQLRESVRLLYKENNNLEVHTMSSFVFKLVKKYNLILDPNMLKKDYEKTFNNLIKQAKNVIKNKKMFKGIFIDESECFEEKNIKFIEAFLYEKKYIFNIFYCESLNIYNNVNIFKKPLEYIDFNEKISLNKNYRQQKNIIDFSNRFCENAIEYLVKNKGLDYGDIAIVFPYNKKKLKNGKTIYFQYLLRKALDDVNIPYIIGDDDLTKHAKKTGITLSNLYFIKNLEYKAVVFCELEMLYNQTINKEDQDYQINDFIGDLNKIYMVINRASEYLTITTTFNENSSELIKILVNSINT